MLSYSIGIIGGGNLGRSIALGLLESRKISPDRIFISRRRLHLIEDLQAHGIKITSDNREVIREKKVIVLSVEPHQATGVLKEISQDITGEQMIISVVTGLSIRDIKELTGERISVFRAMPNTAIAIRQSMTCISTKDTSPENEDIVFSIFDQLGKTIKIEEELMNASTVLAACGIAYALRFIRAASQGGIEIGFDAATAQLIAAQTVKGAAGLLIEGGKHPEFEIDKVTTPMGCTIAGLNEMEHQGFSSSLIKGILTSYHKI
ncbi:MAG: pyrroline-5-carboxylate reductase [Cyclobacteriaceae bacterium]|jgi:pyrroline-5-carboxylate reductase|nr:pyrroline-5-carboxylate reductase [Cyclobacteriaceae bacterium]